MQLYEAGQYAQAIDLWQASLAEMGQLQQVLCWSYLALAHQKLGNWLQAEQLIAQSFERLRQAQISDPQILAQLFNSQGQIQLGLGQPELALTSWEQSERYYAAAEDELGQMGSQINQAQALQTLGLYRRAQSLLTVISIQLNAQPDSPIKALGLRSLGAVLQIVGNLAESQQVLQQSLEIAVQLDLHQQISEIQFSLANSLRSLQDTEAALQLYQQSAAAALTSMGQLQAQLNQLSLLIDSQQRPQATALAAQLPDPISRLTPSRDSIYLQVNFATQLMQLAAAEPAPDSQRTAAQILSAAIQQAQSLPDQRAESYAVGQLAHLYEQTQQWDIAQSLSQRALLLAQSVNADDISYRWQWQLGRILKQRDLGAAKATYTEALKTLDVIRRDLLSTQPEFQVSFRGDVEPLYRELVELLVQPNATQDDLQQAREAIEALRLAELENFFRSACLDPVQQIDQVDRTAAIFYPILLPNQLLVIVALPNQPLRYHRTTISQTEVEAVIAAFRRSLILPYTSSREIQQIAQQLYSWLVQPVAASLSAEQIETLVFVQDGALQSIPMAALFDGERYLIETYSVALSPGLRLFAPQPLNQVPLKAVTAGLTEARHSFEPLQFVEIELAQIRSEIPSDLLLDQSFTSLTLSEKINSSAAPILHIATHGQFSSQAEQTFILAWDQPITSGRFSQLIRARAPQLEQLELLVLSACETAVGDKRAALGLAGLAIQSGARSTLASLWLIDDESTPLLMTQFYKSLKINISKAAALRQAQLSLLQGRYRHPRFWAAFVLLGNWQ
ncbi:MAG: CHAT domain-containing protein [Pegethrix bostrychoides GSE-TBD4-15B]|uniref:CHAT domain-containing protein n=1 Tax=Pegethrix bostrychoides GSE-TBD4-15B TaxID=2839662 RepID=A0A951PGV7_9CYAN|nr:CHAT domain-containing protein [Pegethrix bostrychoides GSE-TBD4-15B]